ncbi:het domain [Trichoderma arundinaceum]|uniref:Het domain n=1 Tax=Trichoderma arundinaceum TaxID=490622 RepID=A0A395P0N0_TRIAR|nr:het domain [Trichoderma arundinaceum]
MLGLNEIKPGVHIIQDSVATEEILRLHQTCAPVANDGNRYVSAGIVLEAAQTVVERIQLAPDKRERLIYMRDCLQYTSLMMLSATNVEETVRYSICALGEYFSTGLFRVIAQSTPKIDVPVVGFSWHQSYMQSGAFQMDINTYQPSHMPDGCGCALIGIDERATALILHGTDTYPIIRFDQIGEGVDDFELIVEPYEPGVPYVALSHVWANGLGNPKANSLPRCQITRVAQLIASLQAQVEGETEYQTQYRIWIDTLCCPIELEGKLIALERIASVYRNASHVLVLDASLTAFDSQATHPAELLLRVYGASPWMRRLWTLQVSVPSDEPLCISTLMGLDTKYIAAAPSAETRMVRVWELLAKSLGGFSPRLLFYADEVLNTSGWRWAPRSLLGSSVKDPVIGIDERVLRLAENTDLQGIPTPLGLKVILPGCRLIPQPLVPGISLHPWPGAINPTEDQIIIHQEESGQWYRIIDWYRSKKLASWTDDERSAFDREQNNPLCREIDSGKCVLIYDETSRADGTLVACMAQIDEIHKDFKHASITTKELETGIRVHRLRTVIMSLLSNEEIRMMTVFRELAMAVAIDQETSNLLMMEDRDGEEWKSCMVKVKNKMKEVVAEAWNSNPELTQAVKNTIGIDMEGFMWAFIPKIFSHDVFIDEMPSEQIWFVD